MDGNLVAGKDNVSIKMADILKYYRECLVLQAMKKKLKNNRFDAKFWLMRAIVATLHLRTLKYRHEETNNQ